MKSEFVSSFGLFARAFSVLVLSGAVSRAADTSGSAAAGPTTHVLFMGVDVSVEKDKKLYHVDDVAGDSFVITVNKQQVRIPTDKKEIALKIDQRLQLTHRTAVVAGLKGDRAYTFGGDPLRRRGLEAVELTTAVQEAREISNINLGLARARRDSAMGDPSGDAGAAGRQLGAKLDLQNAENTARNFEAMAASEFGTGREQMRMGIAEQAKEPYDAIEVECTVSSVERLAEAFVVIIARIREPDSKPGVVRNWIYAKSIGEVTDSPRRLHIKHGGFVPGYILEGYDLHLFSEGKEVATNVSPKRVELTKDDAAQYALIEYLASNKEATVAPVPALGQLPPGYHEHLGDTSTPKVCYVKVSRDGVPTEIYVDEACSQKLTDSYLEGVLKQIWFKPALSKGKPVDGVAKVKLASLRM